jgi:hypothetical protein
MGKKKSKNNSKKGKSNKERAKNVESNVAKEQNQQKTSYEDISEIFWGGNPDKNVNNDASTNLNNDTSSTENVSQESEADESDNASESEDTENAEKTTSTDANQCYEEIKAKQQELLNNLKNLTDSIANITLTRDNVASLSIELLSNIYFTRQIRPLIDAVNLISFASSNISNVAQNINTNPFGDKKEAKDALKLSYKMNDEIDDLINTLTRRLGFYVGQLDKMDKNCPPFSFNEDS